MSFTRKAPWGVDGNMREPMEYPATGSSRMGLIKGICHAAAVVLLVGFFFDGGLFKMALAVPFWILLELGNVANREMQTTRT
jgi:hypothetical protein